MNQQRVNQVTAVVGLALIVVIFVLLASGAIPGIAAIALTIGVGVGVRVLRSALGK